MPIGLVLTSARTGGGRDDGYARTGGDNGAYGDPMHRDTADDGSYSAGDTRTAVASNSGCCSKGNTRVARSDTGDGRHTNALGRGSDDADDSDTAQRDDDRTPSQQVDARDGYRQLRLTRHCSS